MHIESSQQVARSKLNSVVSLFVYLVADIEISFLNAIEFHNFVQFIDDDSSWPEEPRLQVLNQLQYKALVYWIVKVVVRVFSKFVKALVFYMVGHLVFCL